MKKALYFRVSSKFRLSSERNTSFFIIRPTRCTNFTNLFCHETLHISDSSSVHHQEFIHYTLSKGICHTAFEQGSKAVWYIPLLYSVQWINSWWWTEELSETCSVSCQNKICEIGAFSWFYYKEICYDARSVTWTWKKGTPVVSSQSEQIGSSLHEATCHC
jgi:hypothetical protein